MSRRAMAYLVTCDGRPMWEEWRKFAKECHGVLYFGGAVTLFRTRRAAERAIRRTVQYANDNGLPWETRKDYHVHRVERSA